MITLVSLAFAIDFTPTWTAATREPDDPIQEMTERTLPPCSGSVPYSWTGITMQTSQEPVGAGTEHGSMGNDGAMPDSVTGGASEFVGPGTKNLYLFDAYLDAMCSF